MKDSQFSWKKLSSTVLHSSPFVSLRKDCVVTDKNKTIEDYYVVDYGLGAVGVVLQDSQNQFLLIKHYRYSVDEVFWEIPAGRIDQGEDGLQAAKRELLEETGYVGTNCVFLGEDYPAIGNSSLRYQYFWMQKGDKVEMTLDEEVLDLRWFSYDEVCDLMREGKIASGLCISAFMHYLLKQRK